MDIIVDFGEKVVNNKLVRYSAKTLFLIAVFYEFYKLFSGGPNGYNVILPSTRLNFLYKYFSRSKHLWGKIIPTVGVTTLVGAVISL